MKNDGVSVLELLSKKIMALGRKSSNDDIYEAVCIISEAINQTITEIQEEMLK